MIRLAGGQGMLFLPLASLVAAEYAEQLDVTPLGRHEVLSSFTFDISQSESSLYDQIPQYDAFPRTLGQILARSNTKELHLRFTQGSWNAPKWGALPLNGTSIGGTGVELWAFVDGPEREDAHENWHRLVHSLGGYFCASINFINDATTTWPSRNSELLQPYGLDTNNTFLLRGALPAEPVCTENLTPFIKLLPCRGKAGIGQLLDGHTLFAARFQTMSVDVWLESGQIRLRQQIIAVHDTQRAVKDLPYSPPSDSLVCDESKPWANSWTCLPVPNKHSRFDISEIFGSNITAECAVAANPPQIRVHAPENWEVSGGNNPVLEAFDGDLVSKSEQPLLMGRSISGWGQQHGGIRTSFTNTGSDSLLVKYLDTLPWFMRVYLHTTRLRGVPGLDTLDAVRYIPSKDRARPTQIEFELEVPPGARIELEFDFETSLLFLEEYPPDANHGFEVMPGLAVATNSNGDRYEVRTPSLLLALPVPDFSMPYNVIILTSTVMALAFGTIYNLVDRDVIPEDQAPPRVSLLNRLLAKFGVR